MKRFLAIAGMPDWRAGVNLSPVFVAKLVRLGLTFAGNHFHSAQRDSALLPYA
jgi:hypothetical protein